MKILSGYADIFFDKTFCKGNFMSDSKETNELDSYGVWVKNPPKTVDSSETSVNSDDAFNFDTDLPDFSDLDVIDEPSEIMLWSTSSCSLMIFLIFSNTISVSPFKCFLFPPGNHNINIID